MSAAQLLQAWARKWTLDGDLARCRCCLLALHVSRNGELMHHKPDCSNARGHHPWDELLEAIQLAALPAASATADAEIVRSTLREIIGELDLQQPSDDYSTADLAGIVLRRAIRDMWQSIADVERERDEARAERDHYRAALKLETHKVLTCGVAATHPDASLTLRADYMQWSSPQADYVRRLRAERDALRAKLAALVAAYEATENCPERVTACCLCLHCANAMRAAAKGVE